MGDKKGCNKKVCHMAADGMAGFMHIRFWGIIVRNSLSVASSSQRKSGNHEYAENKGINTIWEQRVIGLLDY